MMQKKKKRNIHILTWIIKVSFLLNVGDSNPFAVEAAVVNKSRSSSKGPGSDNPGCEFIFGSMVSLLSVA